MSNVLQFITYVQTEKVPDDKKKYRPGDVGIAGKSGAVLTPRLVLTQQSTFSAAVLSYVFAMGWAPLSRLTYACRYLRPSSCHALHHICQCTPHECLSLAELQPE